MRFEVLVALLPVALAAPLITPRAGQVIEGRYIVKMKEVLGPEISAVLNSMVSLLPQPPAHVYALPNFKGFAAEFDDLTLNLFKSLANVSRF